MATFDRILGDILDFVRRFLWWKTDKTAVKHKPFQSIRKPITGDTGIACLVLGRDTPRAVRTWIFSPRRRQNDAVAGLKSNPLDDIHVYLDFLGPLANAPETKQMHWNLSQRKTREKGEAFLTHRVQILKASHMLNAHGFYDYELLFWQDYDFYRPGSGDPERWAVAAVDRLVYRILSNSELDWESAIANIRQVVLGTYQPRGHQVA
ncbi:MAG: hypothetical protein AAFR42_05540 [Cyanobacteria bacterium J06628_6]